MRNPTWKELYPGRLERMQELVVLGWSAAMIAGDLGCTRNAVCGKLWRENMKTRGIVRLPLPSSGGRPRRIPFKREILMPIAPKPVVKAPVLLIEFGEICMRPQLDHCCRWPLAGEPGLHMVCCGRPRLGPPGKGPFYCEEHYARSHTAGSPRPLRLSGWR